MAELLKLNVQERTQLGKGPNRRLRATGMVPGVYYDSKGANIPVKVEMVPLQKAFAAVGNAQVFELVLERGGKTEAMPALIWRLRNEPVKGFPEHVDFFGVDLSKELKVAVHFEIVGNSKGVKLGGTLEQYRDHIEVICKPMDIPESIVIDITEMDVMDSVHIEDVVFPEGVTPVFDENYAVLSIAAKHEDEDGEEGEEEAGETETE
ncbi:MAG: 50S ribosomal protein L25 [Pseudodesulfovibrio sp.]|jgi:large subunit ribosomal protein L25|uniref:Large ribosomal subunit protein bL25 n=1 Tax=Pseudodesulfovibrio indicus TaxID=1716143 RepID=A0A126QR64_9BACT|nr:50S ribosomal protein L25 [Pseudodesulfovibrio indicus]AMK12481.1 50S ribosomal protein L25/general stress protein Ctc [Pseudodesulfovibrio indicus]TDT90787.1 LSU ribosomal protein L25P [Pseudodesulfovibrio indicus]